MNINVTFQSYYEVLFFFSQNFSTTFNKTEVMKVHIKSIFEQIAAKVSNIKNLGESRKEILEFVDKSKINDDDKKTITRNIKEAPNVYALQKYIFNALLKYEGMGMNQINKTAREATAETAIQ